MPKSLDQELHDALSRMEVRKYLDRGRACEHESTDVLREMWLAAYARWIDDLSEESSVAEENIRAELLLRGVEMKWTDASPEAVAKTERMLADRSARIAELVEGGEQHPPLDEILDELAKKGLH